MNSDRYLTSALQRSAARAHDAVALSQRISAMEHEPPTIADHDNPTADERAAIRQYLAANKAHCDQAEQAEADKAEALRAYSCVHRLATGRHLCQAGAEVMSHVVNLRGAAEICEAEAKTRPTAKVNVAPPVARHARPREAGRPGHRTTRSSAASGDSGDDPELPPPALKLWQHARWGRVSPGLLRLLRRLADGGES